MRPWYRIRQLGAISIYNLYVWPTHSRSKGTHAENDTTFWINHFIRERIGEKNFSNIPKCNMAKWNKIHWNEYILEQTTTQQVNHIFITWANAALCQLGTSGTNLSEMWIKLIKVHLLKMPASLLFYHIAKAWNWELDHRNALQNFKI